MLQDGDLGSWSPWVSLGTASLPAELSSEGSMRRWKVPSAQPMAAASFPWCWQLVGHLGAAQPISQ